MPKKMVDCKACSHFKKTKMLEWGIHGKCLEKDIWIHSYIRYCRKYDPLGPKETPANSVEAARKHHKRHGDMDGHTCLLARCVLHYPNQRLGGTQA